MDRVTSREKRERERERRNRRRRRDACGDGGGRITITEEEERYNVRKCLVVFYIHKTYIKKRSGWLAAGSGVLCWSLIMSLPLLGLCLVDFDLDFRYIKRICFLSG